VNGFGSIDQGTVLKKAARSTTKSDKTLPRRGIFDSVLCKPEQAEERRSRDPLMVYRKITRSLSKGLFDRLWKAYWVCILLLDQIVLEPYAFVQGSDGNLWVNW
jgi:hypothetical protein